VVVTLKPELGVTQGHRNRHVSIRHLLSYYRATATIGRSRTISEINGDFSRKLQTFPNHPMYFASPLKGFPMELGISTWGQNTRMMATGPGKKFDYIFSCLDTIRQRNGQTDTGRQQRLRLRIASRSKNHKHQKPEWHSVERIFPPRLLIPQN